MVFQAVVFESGKAGEVVSITEHDFTDIVGGMFERTDNKHDTPNSIVIVNAEGVLAELPRNRGYHGTFIVVKEDEEGDEYLSFSDEEVKEIKNLLDTKENFISKNKFLKTFFEEKNVPVTIFHYERGLNIIQINNYDVIESLLASPNTQMLQEAEKIISKIDFVNGDVNHFLQHMGNPMADEIAESAKGFFG